MPAVTCLVCHPPPSPELHRGESSEGARGMARDPQRELAGRGSSNHNVVQIAGEGAMDETLH